MSLKPPTRSQTSKIMMASIQPQNAAFPLVPQKPLPKSVYDPRRHVGVHAERVSDVSNTEYPGHYPGEDHSWDLEKFKKVSCGCDRSIDSSLTIFSKELESSCSAPFTKVHRVRSCWCGCLHRECVSKNPHCRGTCGLPSS